MMSLGNFSDAVNETGLFHQCSAARWELLETNIGFYFYKSEGHLNLRWYQKRKFGPYENTELSFEDMLDLIPEEIQTKLLFHLNLFR